MPGKVRIANTTAAGPCSFCSLKPACLPDAVLVGVELEQLQKHITPAPPKPRGSVLYRAGETQGWFYFLRSGSAKATISDENGDEFVMDFFFPSDMIGLTSLEHQVYAETVVTLERSSVCAIEASVLYELSRHHAGLHQAFFARLGAEFDHERHARVRLNHLAADERVADFLLEMIARMAAVGRASDMLYLPMSRHDIGSYLGLAPETVSRVLQRLHETGVIVVAHKQVTIVSPEVLATMAQRT